jgi:serine/threonine protein kinase
MVMGYRATYAPSMANGAGTVIGGRFLLEESVGQGGMGRVWRGHDQVLDRAVAVKEVLLPAGLPQADRVELVKRTMREARAAAKLSHPGVITIHDVVEHNGAPWIVMEFITGRSLAAELAASGGRLSWERVADIGAQIADALEAAHAAGIVHRDLKPDNVLLAGRRVVVTDFGIAHVADAVTRLTATGTTIGTPQYMAPEQVDGKKVGPATDLWSLSVTLYVATEGRLPFDGDTLTSVWAGILVKDPPPPQFAGPLTAILTQMLTKAPGGRPSATTVASALRAATAIRAAGTPRRDQTVQARFPATSDARAETRLLGWNGPQATGPARTSPPPKTGRAAPRRRLAVIAQVWSIVAGIVGMYTALAAYLEYVQFWSSIVSQDNYQGPQTLNVPTISPLSRPPGSACSRRLRHW